jgi:peptide/nickel transport system permease protein
MKIAYIARRLGHAAIITLLAALVAFLLLRLAPGDPARLILGDKASADQVANLREKLGLDLPIVEQLWSYTVGLLQGDMGESVFTRQAVSASIGQALPNTLLLVAMAVLLALVVGLPIGLYGGLRGGFADFVGQGIALIGQSVPSFWFGMILISVVAVRWGLLPTSGTGGPEHLVLPTISLALFLIGLVIRVTRASVRDVDREDYVRTARSKGLPGLVIVRSHILKNASIPIMTIVALYGAGLVGGAVVVEVVFAWPGIGQLAVNAIAVRDYPVVQGVVLVSAVVFVVVNLAVDLLYLVVDPRTKYT